MKLRILFFLLFLSPGLASACDLCNCFLGINPQYNSSQAGFRFRYRNAYGPHEHSDMGTGTHHHGMAENVNDSWLTTEVFARFFLNRKWVVFATLPYNLNIEKSHDSGIEKFTGPGDPLLLLQRQIYNRNSTDSTFGHRLFFGAGVKVPLGMYRFHGDSVAGDPHMMPGTGSWDFLFAASYILKWKKWGMAADANFRLSTTNPDGYHFANRFNSTASLFYAMRTKKITVQPNAGYYFELGGRDKQNKSTIHSSGGFSVFASAGTEFYFNNFSFTISGQLPLADQLNGEQPNTKFRTIASAAFVF